ncbi:DUF4258 domain-containing protein [Methylobacterium sp. M6A4_1b]
MTRIILIDHADQRLARRNLERAWIERTVTASEMEEPDPDHPGRVRAFRSLPERDGRVLRVMDELIGGELHVITVILDRKQTRRTSR